MDILKAVILFIAYFFGYRDAKKEIEAVQKEEALKEATKIIVKGDQIREKYNRLRATTPNTWDGVRTNGANKKPVSAP